ncbi:MAG TPA: formate--tetrahydrofolate ligase [Casimicrobium sp.]|jgi:formate--tetrahydrofolate ligase|nr:formate--tetrahydrofolate ligase [Casimicrobium sp.]
MRSDIDIAQHASLQPIDAIARTLGLTPEQLEPYGRTKAKLSYECLASLSARPTGKLILVTAISPTPAGEGKTTTTVGLGDALNVVLAGSGKRAVVCLREPSLGPVFGMKGGAAGGGYAQIVPMEDINLHFTGDFAAIAAAHNLLAAMIDNHIHHGNALDIDVRRVTWKRVVDMNDRALRQVTVALGGPANGFPRESSFDIVVASEVMAILCLADSLKELKRRLGNIVIGATRDKKPVTASDLHAQGAMAALLKDALKPNLVQTLEGTPAFVHGGPFANIAHGCNTVLATRTALKLGDYVVTEAGFGADLGAEKFIDIKCRKSGLAPDAVVLVATIRALKYHGGVARENLSEENLVALDAGMKNLERHVRNMRDVFGLACVVSINRFDADTPAEIALLKQRVEAMDVPIHLATHWADGGKGAVDVAREVLALCEKKSSLKFAYDDAVPLWDKVRAVAQKVYGAADVDAGPSVRAAIEALQNSGYAHFPICIAKTQYSFSNDATLRGAPTGHTLTVREVRLAAGAEFVVVVCGDVMTMPGLPKVPSAERIDIDDDGQIVGLF